MTNELKTILFLHILFAMLLVGGGVAFVVLYFRARGAESMADLRATLANARVLERRLIVPAAGLVGLLGLLLGWRYDAKGILEFGDATWMHISVVLWIAVNVAGVFLGRGVERAVELNETQGSGDLAAAKARLRSPAVTSLLWANVLLWLVILYLMVFQP